MWSSHHHPGLAPGAGLSPPQTPSQGNFLADWHKGWPRTKLLPFLGFGFLCKMMELDSKKLIQSCHSWTDWAKLIGTEYPPSNVPRRARSYFRYSQDTSIHLLIIFWTLYYVQIIRTAIIFKCLLCIGIMLSILHLFAHHNNPMKWVLLLSLLHKWKNWGSERLSILSKNIQLVK